MKTTLTILALATAATASTYTSTVDTVMQARAVSTDGTVAVLKTDRGREIVVPLDKLKPGSRVQVFREAAFVPPPPVLPKVRRFANLSAVEQKEQDRLLRIQGEIDELYAEAWASLTGERVKERVLFYTTQGRVESW